MTEFLFKLTGVTYTIHYIGHYKQPIGSTNSKGLYNNEKDVYHPFKDLITFSISGILLKQPEGVKSGYIFA